MVSYKWSKKRHIYYKATISFPYFCFLLSLFIFYLCFLSPPSSTKIKTVFYERTKILFSFKSNCLSCCPHPPSLSQYITYVIVEKLPSPIRNDNLNVLCACDSHVTALYLSQFLFDGSLNTVRSFCIVISYIIPART